MVKVSFFYPQTEGARFDHAYFVDKHMKLVEERWKTMGLAGWGVEKGLAGGAPGSKPPYVAGAYVVFDTVEDFQKALGAHGDEIGGDIANYTDLAPVIQISEVVK